MVVSNQQQEQKRMNSSNDKNNLLIKEEEEGNDDDEELFPIDDLSNLDEMLNRPRWLVPVLPKQELEILLDKSIDLCKKGLDIKSQACKRFYRDGLLQSFTKILTDDAVVSWKLDIYRCIYNNSLKAIELCVLKLNTNDIDNCVPLLDLLAMLFNPNCKYHLSNSIRNNDIDVDHDTNEYAKSYSKSPHGWLVDFINYFGKLNGFKKLLNYFVNEESSNNKTLLNIQIITSLLKPFGYCYEYLTPQTIETYFLPIIDLVPKFFENLTDEDIKKECKSESKNDSISTVIKWLKQLASKLSIQNTDKETLCKSLEILRLKTILKILKYASFNGKMNALNEINKVLSNIAYNQQIKSRLSASPNTININSTSSTNNNDDYFNNDEWLTCERMSKWIQDNNLLEILLSDCMHQPQYVEKLEKILRFLIKEKSLTLNNLDLIWQSKLGKHEAIEKNIHDLLCKLAWDFTPEQLDHLFICFQKSFSALNTTKKQKEKLLDLIRSLSEDDKEGFMANKVLDLLWNLSYNNSNNNDSNNDYDIIDQAIISHIKILDYSCSNDKDLQKLKWLQKCIELINNDTDMKWVIICLKHIREILQQYQELPIQHTSYHHHSTSLTRNYYYRSEIINKLQQDYSLINMITNNLKLYYELVKKHVDENSLLKEQDILIDGRFTHQIQIQERLNFMKYLLKEGHLYLCSSQAEQLWKCLTINSLFECDRDYCFKWFSKLMNENDPDLEPEMNKSFFNNYITRLDPRLLTDSGIKCFDKFFKAVNLKENYLIVQKKSGLSVYLTDNLDLLGLDYLWKIVTLSNEHVATKAIYYLKDIYINLTSKLKQEQSIIHDEFIKTCIDRLKSYYEQLNLLNNSLLNNEKEQTQLGILRVLNVLKEYIYEFDSKYYYERLYPSLIRSYKSKPINILIKLPIQNKQQQLQHQQSFYISDDIELETHLNETIGCLRKKIYLKTKLNPLLNKLDLIINNECIESNFDNKILSDYIDNNNINSIIVHTKITQIQSTSSLSANLNNTNINNNNNNSSPDSTSSSTDNEYQDDLQLNNHKYIPNIIDSSNYDYESKLPSFILSRSIDYFKFLIELSDYSLDLSNKQLKISEYVRDILDQIPCSIDIMNQLTNNLINENTKLNIYLNLSLTKLWYYLKLTYTLLVPIDEYAYENDVNLRLFKDNFILLNNNNSIFLLDNLNINEMTDDKMKKEIYLFILRINKLLLLNDNNLNMNIKNDHVHKLIRVSWSLAATNTLDLIQQNNSYQFIHEKLINQNKKEEKDITDDDDGDDEDEIDNNLNVNLCSESLEVLRIILNKKQEMTDILIREKSWHLFICDLLIHCSNSLIRQLSMQQFYLIALNNNKCINFFIQMLFTCLQTSLVNEKNSFKSKEYFELISKLLNYAYLNSINILNTDSLLNNEIQCLKKIKETYQINNCDNKLIDEYLLDGHLALTKQLLLFQSSSKKYFIGSQLNGINLIDDLIQYFLLSYSYLYNKFNNNPINNQINSIIKSPICKTSSNQLNAYDLLVALCTNCFNNLKYLSDILIELFYNENENEFQQQQQQQQQQLQSQIQPIQQQSLISLNEWDYLPPVGSRPENGFVGLKNAGATCYMNSVLQQLFMIKPIRDKILSIQINPQQKQQHADDDDTNELVNNQNLNDNQHDDDNNNRNNYNLIIFKHIQMIFGHLLESKLQFYVPKGFWKSFRLFGERINIREQHDAVEFYNSVVDCIDESMKQLQKEQICSQVLGGTFADQKICIQCPHRYTREESFTLLSVDVKHSSKLIDSLEQYVKGDLLDGQNAYFCEKCNKKVDTIKRTCIKRLPQILAIQLKRFDYDWEREAAVKSNEYFEFPRELDMKPYTVNGINDDLTKKSTDENSEIDEDANQNTKYRLVGIVVHSGQANGGHYYSYIQDSSNLKWYKFDDNEVNECKMDDDEMRNQCYGGDYTGEVYDNIMKRMSFKKQKRWWNAYILFYEQLEQSSSNEMPNSSNIQSTTPSSTSIIPSNILKCVQKKNIRFLHYRNHFSLEYFHFMKKLAQANIQLIANANKKDEENRGNSDVDEDESTIIDNYCLIITRLISQFLFSIGFRVKKSLRGQAYDWYEIYISYLKASLKCRQWFAYFLLVESQSQQLNLIQQYLLECPSTDIRTTFTKILVTYVHLTLEDNLQLQLKVTDSMIQSISISDSIINSLISLLKRDIVNETGKHCTQYFQFFNLYAQLGLRDCLHLIKLDVVFYLIQFITHNINNDDTHHHRHSHQHTNADLAKLYSIISLLLRCYEISPSSSSINNPFSYFNEINQHPNEIIKLPAKLNDYLFNRCYYIKKILEDMPNFDDNIKLFKYLCYENMSFSLQLISELLWMTAYHYSYELKPHLDLLYELMFINDTWQSRRLNLLFNGIPNDKDGLFDIMTKSQQNYQKRSYQIIKMLVNLLSTCDKAFEFVENDVDLKNKWQLNRLWFYNEMERQRLYTNSTSLNHNNSINNTYFQTASLSSISNETSQSYCLERTNSARLTLDKALKLFPNTITTTQEGITSNQQKQNDSDLEIDKGNDSDEEDSESLKRIPSTTKITASPHLPDLSPIPKTSTNKSNTTPTTTINEYQSRTNNLDKSNNR